MNTSLSDKIIVCGVFCSAILMLLVGSYYSFHIAWIEWELSEKLAQEGIPAQAFAKRCILTRENCSTFYEYKAPSSDGKIQTYTVREHGCNCEKGEEVTIFYLPDDPNQARLYVDKHFIYLMWGAICMMWLIGLVIVVIVLFFPDFLVSRVKILMD